MKQTSLIILALCMVAVLESKAQTSNSETPLSTKKEIKKATRDFVMLQVFHDRWSVPNGEKLRVGGLGRGFAGYLCYDFPIGKKELTNFSFAAGLGISTHNIYFDDNIPLLNVGKESLEFQRVDTMSGEDKFKKIKLNHTYIEAPFELRFFGNPYNRSTGFKAAIGFKVGLLVGTTSKVRHSETGPLINEKVNSRRYNQSWKFAPTVRIGWGNFSIFGSYNATALYRTGLGPEVYPFSLGLTITGL